MKSMRITFSDIMKYAGVGIALLYMIVGILLLLGSGKFFQVPEPYRLPIGLALLGYGLFRGYRLFKKYNRKKS
jgi:hypothetical protein